MATKTKEFLAFTFCFLINKMDADAQQTKTKSRNKTEMMSQSLHAHKQTASGIVEKSNY